MNDVARGYRLLAVHMVRQAVRDIKSSAPSIRSAGWAYLRTNHCREVLAIFDVDVDDSIGRLKARGFVEERS